jgi:hypothetical protein
MIEMRHAARQMPSWLIFDVGQRGRMNNAPSTTDAIIVGSFVFVAGLGLLSSYASSRRLAEWALREGYTVLKKRAAPWGGSDLEARGGFAGTTFYVTVEDREKNIFGGWVRVGSIIALMLGTPVRVEWDNRPSYLRQ